MISSRRGLPMRPSNVEKIVRGAADPNYLAGSRAAAASLYTGEPRERPMVTTAVTVGREATPVGRLLQHWRRVRRKSQLALALQAGVSARHLGFLEIGRANPSREM